MKKWLIISSFCCVFGSVNAGQFPIKSMEINTNTHLNSDFKGNRYLTNHKLDSDQKRDMLLMGLGVAGMAITASYGNPQDPGYTLLMVASSVILVRGAIAIHDWGNGLFKKNKWDW